MAGFGFSAGRQRGLSGQASGEHGAQFGRQRHGLAASGVQRTTRDWCRPTQWPFCDRAEAMPMSRSFTWEMWAAAVSGVG